MFQTDFIFIYLNHFLRYLNGLKHIILFIPTVKLIYSSLFFAFYKINILFLQILERIWHQSFGPQEQTLWSKYGHIIVRNTGQKSVKALRRK